MFAIIAIVLFLLAAFGVDVSWDLTNLGLAALAFHLLWPWPWPWAGRVPWRE